MMSLVNLSQIADLLEEQADALAERVVDLVWEKVPGYQPPRMRRRDLTDSVAPNLRFVLVRLRTGDPNTEAGERADRIGVARALQGVPLDAIVLSYRTAERVLTDAFAAHVQQLDSQSLRTGLNRLAEGFDELSAASIESYRETQRQVTTHYDRIAGDLVAGLVGGDLDAQQVRTMARLLECDPEDTWQAVALTVGDDPELALGMRVQRDVLATLSRGRPGRILVGAVRGSDVLLVQGEVGTRDCTELERVIRGYGHQSIRMTVGDPVTGLPAADVSCRQALVAMDVATNRRAGSTVTHYGDVLLDVLANSDSDVARGLRQRYLAPIADSPHFIETIEALADADLSIRGAAANLYVHPNTVVYRLGRIRELTGFDPRHTYDLSAFLLALRVRTE